MGDDTQNDSELAEETELGSEMAGHSAEMSSILGDAYLFQGENPAVYGGREADNSLTFHRRLQSEYPTTANLY